MRRERPADHAAVREVHRAAFGTHRGTGAAPAPHDVPESRLTDELREDPSFLPHLALVAVDDAGAVIGHVIATRGWLEPFGVPVLGLGPLGVLPPAQGQGVGTVLVHGLMVLAEATEERLVALLGSPGYYRRFGFVPACEVGVAAPEPAWGEHFQARRLRDVRTGGTFRYAEPFRRL